MTTTPLTEPTGAHPGWVDEATALVDRLADDRRDGAANRRTLPAGHREELADALDATRARMGTGAVSPELRRAYLDLLAARRVADDHDASVRRVVRDAMREAVDGLRSCRTVDELAADVCAAACPAGGFTRVLLSAVRGTRWVPMAVHTTAELDPDPRTLQAFLDERFEIPLANLLAETEMVRRRTGVLVTGATLEKRTFKPIVEAAGSSGYVGAPIVISSGTIGIIHADRVGQREPVTEDDRLVIADFTASVSAIIGRLTAEAQVLQRTQGLSDELTRAAARLRHAAEPARVLRTPGPDAEPRPRGAGDGARDDLLTRREIEVLELVSRGATNGVVAQQLTVSEETIKSHMRTILRKLRVTSRNAAVARYRRLGTVRRD